MITIRSSLLQTPNLPRPPLINRVSSDNASTPPQSCIALPSLTLQRPTPIFPTQTSPRTPLVTCQTPRLRRLSHLPISVLARPSRTMSPPSFSNRSPSAAGRTVTPATSAPWTRSLTTSTTSISGRVRRGTHVSGSHARGKACHTPVATLCAPICEVIRRRSLSSASCRVCSPIGNLPFGTFYWPHTYISSNI